jgi:hypothetical protein
MEEKDFVEFWAYKCRENLPKCQREVYSMIDSQIQIGNDFYKRIGRKKALALLKK